MYKVIVLYYNPNFKNTSNKMEIKVNEIINYRYEFISIFLNNLKKLYRFSGK